jgi:hypothetical protein
MLNRREIENYLYDQSVISSVYSEKSESFNRWFIEKNLNIVKSNIKDEIKLSMFGFDKDKLAKSVAFRKLLTSELKKFIES